MPSQAGHDEEAKSLGRPQGRTQDQLTFVRGKNLVIFTSGKQKTKKKHKKHHLRGKIEAVFLSENNQQRHEELLEIPIEKQVVHCHHDGGT